MKLIATVLNILKFLFTFGCAKSLMLALVAVSKGLL